MCFRLLAALEPALANASEWEVRAAHHGLDARVRGSYLEISWGDCACSLYTRREGRERLVAFVDGLLAAGARVQLLLFSDEQPLEWESTRVQPVTVADFHDRGLAALPEGSVAELG